MSERRDKTWLPLAIIAGGLALWGLLLGVGAWLQVGADHPTHDFRKLLVVLGCVGVFLALWGTALWVRQRRK